MSGFGSITHTSTDCCWAGIWKCRTNYKTRL